MFDMSETSANIAAKATKRAGAKLHPWRLTDIIDWRKLRVQLTAAALDHIGDETETRKRALDLLHAGLSVHA